MRRTATSRRRAYRQRGSALVEGALIFLLLAAMLIGAVDFSQFLFVHQTLTERARQAVRYGLVNDPTDSTSIQNIVLYGQPSGESVPAHPDSHDTGIFNVQRSNVTVSVAGSGTDHHRLSVQIQGYRYIVYSPFIAGGYNGPRIVAALPLGVNY
jgi:hypothetical protein